MTPTDTVDLIVENGTVVTADATAAMDLAMHDGRFVAMAPRGELGMAAAERFEATGLYVLPGVIDGHVHFREPGLMHKEDWRTGSTAAAFGGVTTVLEMPNTIPPTDSATRVGEKRLLAEASSLVDFGLFGLITPGNIAAIAPMAAAGVVGFKCYLGPTVGDLAAPDDGQLLDAMRAVAATGLRIGFHAESDQIVQHGIRAMKAAGRTDPLAHLESRPAVAEVDAIQRVGPFAAETGARIHIFHLSSRQGLDAVEEWRAKGVDITCEATPHHVFLVAEAMARLGGRMRINPPVRLGAEGHAAALLAGLTDGRITSIATDHSPHTAAEKSSDDIWRVASGFPGVETSVAMFLTRAVNAGRMTLQQFARATSEGPARTWGLWPQKGAIAIGSDADLTIIDLDQIGVIRDAALHSKDPVTPYDGLPTRGAPVATIVRGRLVAQDGRVASSRQGRMVRPVDDLAGGVTLRET